MISQMEFACDFIYLYTILYGNSKIHFFLFFFIINFSSSLYILSLYSSTSSFNSISSSNISWNIEKLIGYFSLFSTFSLVAPSLKSLISLSNSDQSLYNSPLSLSLTLLLFCFLYFKKKRIKIFTSK